MGVNFNFNLAPSMLATTLAAPSNAATAQTTALPSTSTVSQPATTAATTTTTANSTMQPALLSLMNSVANVFQQMFSLLGMSPNQTSTSPFTGSLPQTSTLSAGVPSTAATSLIAGTTVPQTGAVASPVTTTQIPGVGTPISTAAPLTSSPIAGQQLTYGQGGIAASPLLGGSVQIPGLSTTPQVSSSSLVANPTTATTTPATGVTTPLATTANTATSQTTGVAGGVVGNAGTAQAGNAGTAQAGNAGTAQAGNAGTAQAANCPAHATANAGTTAGTAASTATGTAAGTSAASGDLSNQPLNMFTQNDYANFLLAGSHGGTTGTDQEINSAYADPNSRFANAGNDQFQASIAGMYANQFKGYAMGLDVAFTPGKDINQLSNNLVTAGNTQMTPEAEVLSKVAATYRGNLTGANVYDNAALQQLLVKWGRSDIASQPNVGNSDVQSIGGVVKALNEEQDPSIRQAWLQEVFDFAGNTPSSPSGAVPNLPQYQQAINLVRGGGLSDLLNGFTQTPGT